MPMLRALPLLAALVLPMFAAHAAAPSLPTPRATPDDGAVQVNRLTQPSLRFATPQDAASAAPGRLQLLTPIGTPVNGLVKIAGRDAVFEPTAPLAGCTAYTLQLAAKTPDATQMSLRSRFTTACSAWTTPIEIDDARTARIVDRPASGAQVVAGANGEVIAAWFQNDGRHNAIEVSRYTPATDFWSAPRGIDLRTAQAESAGIPALAADAQGRVTAVWFQALNGRNAILASRLDPDGDWSAPVRLDDPRLPGNATNPQLAADADGNVAVVWQQPDRRHTGIDAARWIQAQGRWLPAHALDRPPAHAYDPVIAATPDGRFAAAWQQGARGREAVYAARPRGDGGLWQAPQRVSMPGARAQMPALVADAQGGFTAAWVQGSGAKRRLATSRLAAGARAWAPAVVMQTPAPFQGAALAPALAADAAGNVMLAWEQADAAGRDAIFASRFNVASRRWGAPERLDDPQQDSAGNPQLVADAAGNVTCAWYQAGPRGLQVHAARFDPAVSRWSAPTQLSDPRATVEASFPVLAADAAGSVTAVWQQYNGWRTLVMASRLP